MPGLTTTGFVPATVEELVADFEDDFRAAFGSSINLTELSIEGVVIGLLSDRLAVVWEGLEAIVSSQDPNAAANTLLDALCAITGTIRKPASPSSVTLTLTGTPSTSVPSGSQASTSDSGSIFATTADATITTLASWVGTTNYSVGDRVTNSSRAYVCITAGQSAASGGPTTTSSDITDGTVHWRYMGEGTGAGDVTAEATVTGPTVALSGIITEIETPVSGWDSVINLLDADLGTEVETDEDLRIRRVIELARAGTGPVDAIRADLLQVTGVTSVTVFHNPTDTTDPDGIPPHAVEALVLGGTDQDIFDQLLISVAAGIGTHGTTSGTAVDGQGISHTMKFSRPDEIEIYVDVELTVDSDLYPSDGDAQVKDAIVNYGDAQKTGKDAVSTALIGAVFKDVPGVLDITVMDIGIASNPSAPTTIAIALRELAVYDTSRITVVSTPGTP